MWDDKTLQGIKGATALCSCQELANWGGICFHCTTVCSTFTSAIAQDHIKLKEFVVIVAKGLARYRSATICWEVEVGCTSYSSSWTSQDRLSKCSVT